MALEVRKQMAKKREEQPASEPQADVAVNLAPPNSLQAMQQAEAEARRKAEDYERKAAESRARAAEAAAALEIKRREEINAARDLEAIERTVPVIVQQQRDKPVRLRNCIIPCRVPVKVTRRELRQLEGLRSQGIIQLIIGELEKPGDVLPYERNQGA